MKRLVASIIVITLVGVTAGMAEPKDGDGRGKGRGGKSDTDHDAARHERSAGVWQHMMDEFDKDGDGKLSQDEWKASEAARYQRQSRDRERIMARFDKDGDGTLSEEERAEMKKARQARRQQHQRNGEGRKSRQD